MDTIKIDKGLVRRRKNHYKGRHDDSSTMTIILQVVRKTGRRGAGFCYFLLRKILIFRRSNRTLDICKY
ncbi:hypothetical protein LEMLEM_LOCUS22412 [Lemmus lemmus]